MRPATTALPIHAVTTFRRLAGWTVFVAGALHGLSQALPLLSRGL